MSILLNAPCCAACPLWLRLFHLLQNNDQEEVRFTADATLAHPHYTTNWDPNPGFCSFQQGVLEARQLLHCYIVGWLHALWLLPNSQTISKTAPGWALSPGAQSTECIAVMSWSTILRGPVRVCGTACILLIFLLVSFNNSCFMPGLWAAHGVPTLSLDDRRACWQGTCFSWPSYFLC